MVNRRALAIGLLVGGFLITAPLSGCGPATPTSPPGSTPDATRSSSPTPPSAPTGAPSASSGASPEGRLTPRATFTPAGPGQVTIRGQLRDGVEAGCRVLATDDGKTYLLVGGDRSALAGAARVEVVGQPVPDLMTTCQQGTPFQVASVRPL